MSERVIIVGSGPAGLTAAIYAARASLEPLVIEGLVPGGQLTQTTDVENFPGFAEPLAGGALMQAMRDQAARLGVRFEMEEVVKAEFGVKEGAQLRHRLHLSMGKTLEALTVIIATGASARYLGLPSEQQLIGRGVSACATCDGSFFRNQPVAVVGGGDTALEEALYLARIASSVTVIHRRDAFRASQIMSQRVLQNPRIKVQWNHVVEEVLGVEGQAVRGVRLRHVTSGALTDLPIEGLFIAIGHTPNTAPYRGQVELDADGYIVADHTRTNRPGVFAAGDVQDRHYRQAITAAGSGCMAALEAERYLGALEA